METLIALGHNPALYTKGQYCINSVLMGASCFNKVIICLASGTWEFCKTNFVHLLQLKKHQREQNQTGE